MLRTNFTCNTRQTIYDPICVKGLRPLYSIYDESIESDPIGSFMTPLVL